MTACCRNESYPCDELTDDSSTMTTHSASSSDRLCTIIHLPSLVTNVAANAHVNNVCYNRSKSLHAVEEPVIFLHSPVLHPTHPQSKLHRATKLYCYEKTDSVFLSVQWSADSQENHWNCRHQRSEFKAKTHQIRFQLGFCPRPRAGKLTPPDHLAGFQESYF